MQVHGQYRGRTHTITHPSTYQLFHYSNPQPVVLSVLLDVAFSISVLTTGALNLFLSCDNLCIASNASLAPSTTWLAFLSPAYSMMVFNWSPVGGSSVTFNSKSLRWSLFWPEWSAAWSTVALSDASAEICLRRARTREDAGTEDLWKRVITSRPLCCLEFQLV